MLGRHTPWPVTITIAGGKVVSFVERGVLVGARYSKVTPDHVKFGDRNVYTVVIDRFGATTAGASMQGRHGSGKAMLTRG